MDKMGTVGWFTVGALLGAVVVYLLNQTNSILTSVNSSAQQVSDTADSLKSSQNSIAADLATAKDYFKKQAIKDQMNAGL
jgi:hypothetical protein